VVQSCHSSLSHCQNQFSRSSQVKIAPELSLHIVLPVEGDDSSMEGFTCQSSICDFHSWFGSPSVTMYVDNCACTRKQCYGMMSNVGVHQSSCVALLEVQQPPTALKLHSVCTGYPLVVVLFCRSQRIQSKRSRGKGTACTFSQVNELLAGSLSLVCPSSLSDLAELFCALCVTEGGESTL